MGLEVVVSEIIEEGRRQAAAIEKEGLEEAKAILEDARAKAERILSDKNAQAERDADRIRQQEVARAEFEAKRKVLTAKRALWDRLHDEALDALRNLPEGERARTLERLLAKATKEIPRGTAHVRQADVKLVQGRSGYEIVGDLDAIGGVVVEDPEGRVSLDYRFESLLEEAWPRVLKEESSKLFG